MRLFKHQIEGVGIGRQGSRAFFWDCGTGKSCLGLNIIKHWKALGDGPALVVCPLSIIDAAWIEDCKKFTPFLSIVSLHAKSPATRKQRLAEKHDIYVANFETFKSLFKEIQKKRFKVLIVDESSKMKDPRSQITRSLLAMAGVKTRGKDGKTFVPDWIVPNRYVLSGTPAPNDESEYWSQIKFITGPGNDVFNDNYYAFRGRYFYSIPLGRTGQNLWKFRKDCRDEFANKLSEVSHVVRKADAIDLPDQVHEIRHVELSKEERKAYDTFENELVIQFANETILGSNSLVEIMKLRQLTSGFCYGDVTHQTGKSKQNELLSLLEEIGKQQVIIWCNFKYEIAELLKALPSSDALWSGTPDRGKTINAFQNGQFQYLIANPQSAAHGLTFTNCNYAVYYSLNYSYELQKQSEDRIHRIGQTNKCTYYHLLARKSIDEIIYRAVNNKAELSNEILSYLRKGKSRKGVQRARSLQTA